MCLWTALVVSYDSHKPATWPSFFILLSEAVDHHANGRTANQVPSVRFAAWRNGFNYGRIIDGVEYLNGSGAMTTAARRKWMRKGTLSSVPPAIPAF